MKKFCLKVPLLFVIAVLLLLFEIFSACASQVETKKLHILMDIPIDPTYVSKSRNDIADYLKEAIVYSTDIEPEAIEMEVLPTEEEERSVRINALRTEIMSGKGPDVFFLTDPLPVGQERKEDTDGLASKHPFRHLTDIRERLFQNPQRSMESGAFLPLNNYLKNAQFFDSNVIEPAILAAGQTDEGQMILPLTFTMPTAVFEEASAERSEAEQCAVGATAWNQFPDLFGQIADYKEEKLLFSKEDLLQTVKTALSSCTVENEPREFDGRNVRLYFSPEETNGLIAVGSLYAYQLGDWRPDYFSGEWQEGVAPEWIAPVKNQEDGVTAQITTYACINRNTKRPDEAFQVLDLLISRELMGDIPIKKDKNNAEELGVAGASLVYHCTFGVPVRNDLLENGDTHFAGGRYIGQATGSRELTGNPETYAIYKNLRSQVTTARFYGELDWELQEMFNTCREAKTDEEIEKIVSKAYDTMLMILAES